MTTDHGFEGDHMDQDERELRQHFTTAVGEATPDVTALVQEGEARGARLRRRHRLQGAAGLVAAAVLTIGAVALGPNLVDHDSAGPTDTSPTGSQQLVDATPRGMAAAVLSHLDGSAVFAVAGQSEPDQGHHQVMADIGYRAGGDKVELQVTATDDVAAWTQIPGCDSHQPGSGDVVWCSETDGPVPTFRELVVFDTPNGSGLAMAISGLRRGDGQLLAAVETFRAPSGQEVGVSSMPIGFDSLEQIVTDPAVGLSTTAELNDRGEGIKDFKESLSTISGSGSATASAAPVESSGATAEIVPSAGSSATASGNSGH